MKKEIKGIWYEVVEVVPKKLPQHDLLICMSEYGFRECFQRCDWEETLLPDKRKLRWTN